MEKLSLKRNLPRLLIVEGLWGSGKTKFIKRLSDLGNYRIIEEPIHTQNNIKKGISQWYYKQHKQRFLNALELLKKGKVIMERSLLSSIAYSYSKTGKSPKNYQAFFSKLNKIEDAIIVFLFTSKSFFYNKIKLNNEPTVRDLFLDDKAIYNRYVYFYQNILPNYINKKVIIIKTNSSKKFIKQKSIFSKFVKYLKPLKKISVDCASAILFDNNKILLLYDHKYKHYVLPQGHQNKNEKLSDTVIREAIEETGYNNLKIIKKIKKYKYHYIYNSEKIYKTVHVYLLKIISKKKIKKKIEFHEHYSNYFFDIDMAIRKVRWPQDKKVIELSKKYVK